MSQTLYIHPENPQYRLINIVTECLNNDGVIVIPTDSGYALAATIESKKAQDRIKQIRELEKNHFFSLMCGGLSDISTYAKVDNSQYRLLKNHVPGPFTFILESSRELPKRLFSNKRKTIGIRVPDNKIISDLVENHSQPILTTTLILPNQDTAEMFIDEIEDKIGNQVDLIIDGAITNFEPTTVVDLSESSPILIRQGQGVVDFIS